MRPDGATMTMPADILGWRAVHTREIANGLSRAAGDLLAQVPGLCRSRPAGGEWDGAAASAATQRHDELTSAHRVCAQVVATWAQVLGRTADEIATVQNLVVQAHALASRNHLEIHGRGCTPRAALTAAAAGAPLDPAAAALAQRQHLVAAQVAAMLERACQEADQLIARSGAELARADGLAVLGATVTERELTGAVGIVTESSNPAESVPAVGSDPLLVAAWWRALTPLEQSQVITERPELVGRLDGAPVAARDRANRSLLDRVEADLRAQREGAVDGLQVAAWAAAALMPGTWMLRNFAANPRPDLNNLIDSRVGWPGQYRLDVIDAKIASIEAIRRDLATADGRQRTLIDLDVSQSLAMAAVGVGDLEHAEHVAVFVPGFSSTVDGTLQGYDWDLGTALDEADAMLRKHGDAGRSAGIVWLGYQAPQWSNVGDVQRTVARTRAADVGAERLAPFVNGVVASRSDPVHLTVVAHSYGSTTLGAALIRHATLVDSAVVAGSPGLEVSNAAQLDLGPGQVYALKADDDPVTFANLLGGSPVDIVRGSAADLPGVDRLSADAGVLPDGTYGAASIGHSEYLVPGTTSVHNIGAVIAGQTSELVR